MFMFEFHVDFAEIIVVTSQTTSYGRETWCAGTVCKPAAQKLYHFYSSGVATCPKSNVFPN